MINKFEMICLGAAWTVAVALMLFLVWISAWGCTPAEKKYLETRYPGCRVTLVEQDNGYSEYKVQCPNAEPKIHRVKERK